VSDSLGSFGPFDLLVRLGQGGMGEVWKARRRGAAEDAPFVVVKRVLPHLSGDAEIVRMFQREARLCARLEHPNIVRVLDFGEVSGELYLEMDYVHGIDVIQVMRRFSHTGVPPGAAAYTVAAIARALAYAHALPDDDGHPLRLVHRDVTPSNVMLAVGGEVKLLDFGVAKALSEASESRTATGTLKGKFGYMAPEQVEGAPATHATDQFSVGVILHEMLTGRRLFRGENDMQTIARVKAALVAPPSRQSADVPRELDAICLRALERVPTRRFPDCAALADALEEVAARLGWSAAQNAALIDGSEPIQPGGAPALILALDRAPHDTVRARPPATNRSLRWSVTVLAGMLAVGAAVAVHFRRSAPPASVAPTPTRAPPNAMSAAPETLPAPVVPAPVATRAPAPRDPQPARVKSQGARVAHDKTARVRPPRPRPATSPSAPATTTPATTGKVRAGQVLDPFAR
jgi:serine/threonine-protein kinase